MVDGVEGGPAVPGPGLRWVGQLVASSYHTTPGGASDELFYRLAGQTGGEFWAKNEQPYGWVAYLDGYRVIWDDTIFEVKNVTPPPELVTDGS